MALSAFRASGTTLSTLDYAPDPFHPRVIAINYGQGPQSAYRAAAERAIESIALKIFAYKTALHDSPATRNPFLDLLKELSQRRHQHAVEAKSPDAEEFGRARGLTCPFFREPSLFLYGQYTKCSDDLKAFIRAQLEAHFEASAVTSLPTTAQFTIDELFLGQQTQVTFEIKDIATLRALELEVADCHTKGSIFERLSRYIDNQLLLRYQSGDQFYREMVLQSPYVRARIETAIATYEPVDNIIAESIAQLRELDQESLFRSSILYKEELAAGRCIGESPRAEPYPDYAQIKLTMAIQNYSIAFPSALEPIDSRALSTDVAANARTHFLIVTLSHRPESIAAGFSREPFEALTRYVLPLQADPGQSLENTLNRMFTHATPLMLHQDAYSLQKTLDLCSSLFEKIMLWKVGESPSLLKEQMAGMIWLLAHNHRDARGTAAETEWLERAIYKAHGFAVRALTTRMIDCVALTTLLLSEFVPAYSDSLTLEPLPLDIEKA